MNFTLLKHEVLATVKLFSIILAVLMLYIISTVYMYNPEMNDTLHKLTETMPELMSAFGMNNIGNTLIEFLSTYLYGFLLLVFPLVFIIMLANKLMMGYIDNGSMAYLIATPNTRFKIVFTQAFFLVASIFTLLTVTTLVVVIFSEILFPNELNISAFLILNIGLFFLHFAISGYCFFVSCSSKDLRTSYAYSTGIPILFYLIQALSNMGGSLEKLKYFTIYSLFAPEKLMTQESSSIWMLGALFLIGLLCYMLAIRVFVKRDLYL
ncbi:ABC transporter permease subunit [Lysinibacillus agricola]|uniref:ABC transporter permease subunit n=1 Tax=Lysinibacillus agricola TaxID=2590012 RepID=A0ABX7B0E3_9BACI|nr:MULTISPECIES: ABC transporter permease subunit [Lysinibacillus]QQP13909.1 ABC transporter permease subunit [Lysinibacillus agricola]